MKEKASICLLCLLLFIICAFFYASASPVDIDIPQIKKVTGEGNLGSPSQSAVNSPLVMKSPIVSKNQVELAEKSDKTTDSAKNSTYKGEGYVPNQLIVKYKADVLSKSGVEALSTDLNAAIGAKILDDVKTLGIEGMQLIEFSSGISVEDAVLLYKKHPYVEYAEPNYYRSLYDTYDVANSSDLIFNKEYEVEEFEVNGDYDENTDVEVTCVSQGNVTTSGDYAIDAIHTLYWTRVGASNTGISPNPTYITVGGGSQRVVITPPSGWYVYRISTSSTIWNPRSFGPYPTASSVAITFSANTAGSTTWTVETRRKTSNYPNDPYLNYLWGIHNTGQLGGINGVDVNVNRGVWTQLTRGSSTIIAVVDTGVNWNHPDLSPNMWGRGYNALTNQIGGWDDQGHGTHCAGTIAARGNNGRGVVGVNWYAKIMPIKIFDANGRTNTAAILRGIYWGYNHGARIFSCSYGGYQYSNSERDQIKYLSNAIFICAAGNENTNVDRNQHYPSCYNVWGCNNIISVGSIDQWGSRSSFSNYGRYTVDLFAPGSSILSTTNNYDYGYKSGTSMATPHVTGIVGLIRSMYPTLSVRTTKMAILNGVTVQPGLSTISRTSGRANAHRALSYAYYYRQYGYTGLNDDYSVQGIEDIHEMVNENKGNKENVTFVPEAVKPVKLITIPSGSVKIPHIGLPN